ncbi:hypothetical protein J2Y69_000647 [Microbacterium resistens]|uniref:DUF6993 domain-containing protein n=1 Tax=Microbacterium resistens TaxID=156977 RepID=A0ABU1SB15_9MICO|nr:hypothetical protein [Microbacterium resistens]MDR6866062.1 hypothetical protein [Microbacterium resistens]
MLRSNRPSAPGRPVRLTAGMAFAAAMLLLAGCTPGGGGTKTPTPTPTAGEVVEAPALKPEGTAEDNLPFFSAVVAQVWATEQRTSSLAYVDALTTAGFARADMQATYDVSTVDNPAESMQFSVRWGTDKCLIGQVGPSTGEPVATVMPQLAEGRCLIGGTMPLDG